MSRSHIWVALKALNHVTRDLARQGLIDPVRCPQGAIYTGVDGMGHHPFGPAGLDEDSEDESTGSCGFCREPIRRKSGGYPDDDGETWTLNIDKAVPA